MKKIFGFFLSTCLILYTVIVLLTGLINDYKLNKRFISTVGRSLTYSSRNNLNYEYKIYTGEILKGFRTTNRIYSQGLHFEVHYNPENPNNSKIYFYNDTTLFNDVPFGTELRRCPEN